MIVYHWVRASEPHVLLGSAKRLDSNGLKFKGGKFIGLNAVTTYEIISKSCTWS